MPLLLSTLLLCGIITLISNISSVTAVPSAQMSWKDSSEAPKVDVVVVGGGYSGVMAAYELNKAGLDVVLLEAKDTLGGKVRSVKSESNDGIIEMGATWINNITQPHVTKLTELFGLETLEQPTAGDNIFESYDGTIHRTPEGAESEVSSPQGFFIPTDRTRQQTKTTPRLNLCSYPFSLMRLRL
jgi:monoamine oxidase